MIDSLVHTLLGNALAATFMAVLAAGLAWMFRRPALTHSVWLVVILKLVTPPFVTVSLPVASLNPPIESSRERLPVTHDAGLNTGSEPLPQFHASDDAWPGIDQMPSGDSTVFRIIKPDFGQAAVPQADKLAVEKTTLPSGSTSGWSWEPSVLVLILVGALGWWTLATARIIRFQHLLKDMQPASPHWQLHSDQLAGRVGLSWRPSLYLVPGRVPPMLWAIGSRPRLLVPEELWTKMGADGRTSLLLHELAHLKRRDHWVRWLELVVAGLYWWHPVVWWARRALREAEEQCCDAWVVWAMPDRARTYAGALLAAVEFVSGSPTAPAVASATSGSGHVSCLKRRLQMIVRANTPKGLSRAGRFAVLGMASFLLPLSPSWAQDRKAASTVRDPLTAVDQQRYPTDIRANGRIDRHQRIALLTEDDDKDDKARDAAERFQEHLKDLAEKLGKELGPVAEEVRKSLEKAVGEIHKSLEKEGLSAEDLTKALEKSHDDLRKAFEGGGPVDKELREAIEKARKDLQEAFDRTRGDVEDQAKTLRERSRELRDRAREEFRRGREEMEKGTRPGDEAQPERDELESARREIRDLEQKLRSATRRLDELQRRESRRATDGRRQRNRQPEARPEEPATPRSEPTPAEPPRQPAAPQPPGRPTRPNMRRPLPPTRTVPGAGRRGPQTESDARLRELEEKMNRLLKELESLKGQKSSTESKAPTSPANARPARESSPITS